MTVNDLQRTPIRKGAWVKGREAHEARRPNEARHRLCPCSLL